MTFGNTSQKLWPNMLLFSLGTKQSGHIRKKHFFLKQQFENVFLDLYISGML